MDYAEDFPKIVTGLKRRGIVLNQRGFAQRSTSAKNPSPKVKRDSVLSRLIVLELAPDSYSDDVLEEIVSSPSVMHAEIPAIRFPQAVRGGQFDPGDSAVSENELWPHEMISYWPAIARTAPGITATVKVAVVDSGIDKDHPHFKGLKIFVRNYIDEHAGDPVGHGTGVCGIIAAKASESTRFHGIAEPELFVCKAIPKDAKENYNPYAYYRAIGDLANYAPDVLNLSLAGDYDLTEHLLLDELVQDCGTVIVAASGNFAEHGNPKMYPASLDSVISVGSVKHDRSRSLFSCTGPCLNLVAPGEGVVTSSPSGVSINGQAAFADDLVESVSGTSFAAPFVAGVVCYLRALKPSISPREVRECLESTCACHPEQGGCRNDSYGHGLLNMDKAVSFVSH